jgi:hypothetical protein
MAVISSAEGSCKGFGLWGRLCQLGGAGVSTPLYLLQKTLGAYASGSLEGFEIILFV